jgi:hypothetical protein
MSKGSVRVLHRRVDHGDVCARLAGARYSDCLAEISCIVLNLFGLQRMLGPRVIMISRYHVGINFLSYLPNLENPTPL